MAPMGAGLTTRADRMFAQVDRQLLTLRTECGVLGRGGHRPFLGGNTGQRRLGGPGSDRGGSHVGQADPGLADAAVVPADGGGYADDGPGLGNPLELLVAVAPGGPASLGSRTSTSTSFGASAEVRWSTKNSAAGTVRRPPGPCTTISASSAGATAGRSPARSACASAPPKVPQCRTPGRPPLRCPRRPGCSAVE